jgi:cytidyltransferase-like protein
MAHKSLTLKLMARNAKPKLKKESSADNLLHLINSVKKACQNGDEIHHPKFEPTSMKMVNFLNDQIEEETENYNYKKKRSMYLEDQQISKEIVSGHESRLRTKTVPNNLEFPEIDTRVDKVYTIGCFDLFHHGHVNLIQRMRKLGKKVVVGVHDSRSIYKLKNRVPVDSTEKRMLNVKTVADEVNIIL